MNSRTNWTIGLVLAGAAIGIVAVAFAARVRPEAEAAAAPAARAAAPLIVADEAAAKEAFTRVYTVFMHGRCMNCHPIGDRPLQGDDHHMHTMNVQRGPEGKGLFALKCANCHQDANLAGENMPPGNPSWHLPPPEMKLVFEGKSPGELCRQLKDPKLNGGKTLDALLKHVSEDSLVLWGWNPGDGRSQPPLSHDEFVVQFRKWLDNGAACPD